MTHICVSKLTIIDSDNGLSPDRRQAIIWTNARTLLLRPLGTNFSEILIEVLIFSFSKMRLKVSSVKWQPFCLSLNVLTTLWKNLVDQRTTWPLNSYCSPYNVISTNHRPSQKIGVYIKTSPNFHVVQVNDLCLWHMVFIINDRQQHVTEVLLYHIISHCSG